jgi:hypothetical protein
MTFVREPLDAPPQCIHVRELEDVGHHDDLVITEPGISNGVMAGRRFDEQEMCDGFSSKFKITVGESRKTGYMGYSVDDGTNLISKPRSSRTLSEKAYLGHG